VNRYLGVLSASLTTFAVTNIDDAFLLTVFFARRIPERRIIAGQYLGFAMIIVVSLIAALAALAIPHRWIGLLGLLPLALGIRDLFRVNRVQIEPMNGGGLGVLSIALVTLSNGADNVGVYVPFFVFGRPYLWLILVTYAMLIGLWCFFGRWLGHRSVTLRLVNRWAEKTVPLIFILLGIFILARSVAVSP
jgi:cadmium resistance protein CadD (predicted permease)